MEYESYQNGLVDDYYDEDELPDPILLQDYHYRYLPAEILEAKLANFHYKDEWTNLVVNCMGTIALQSAKQIQVLLLFCLTSRIYIRFLNSRFTRSRARHKIRTSAANVVVAIKGFIILYYLNPDNFYNTAKIIFFYIVLTYMTLRLLKNVAQSVGTTISLLTVIYLFTGELLISNPAYWHQIRGIVLMLAMKVVSLAFDLDRKVEKTMPDFLTYFGYCMHNGTLLFGPWISISHYVDSVSDPKPLSISWILHVLKSLVQAFVCLLLSSCVFSYLFIDGSQPELPAVLPLVAGRWMSSYKAALSFHFSHYYISYLAQTTCMLSGVGVRKSSSSRVWSEFTIVKPLAVEIPYSMLSVVVGWNIPMSHWLKTYIFNTYSYLGKSTAVFLTYAASAMLHGLSFHLAAILLSLAFYTYVERGLRLKLSQVFDCVHIQARVGQSDSQTEVPMWATCFNLCWVLINSMHLAYLGSMFESDDEYIEAEGYAMKYTLEKWANLGFFSHWFAFACFIFSRLI